MKLKAPSRAACTLIGGIILLVATTIFAQQNSQPSSKDAVTAKQVCKMIKNFHISQKEIDDDISKKLVKRFLKVLDPPKLYFLQSDIDEYSVFQTRLDDLVKVGDVTFTYTVYDRFLQRVNNQLVVADALIDEKYDFTVDETMVISADELDWAKSQKELNERWRKRIKYDLLSIKIADSESADTNQDKKDREATISPRTRLHKRYEMLKRTYNSTEKTEKLEIYLSALTHCFDPHSSYMSPQTLEEFRISMELSLEGIGAALRTDDGYTIVAQIIAGGAADKDGRLVVGDKIIAVGQDDGEFVDIIEMKLSKVVRLIRGKKNTRVRLRVLTSDTGETKVFELTRQKIDLSESSAVKGEILDTGGRLDGRQARIGVINIPSFYRDFRGAQSGVENFKSTARDVQKALLQFQDGGGVDGIIVDLRNNGGGALSEAIEVSGLFVKQGPVVQVKEQSGNIKSHNDDVVGEAYQGPLVILCNRLSASASEIFAGVIKDYRRGLIVGDTTTHGKGTVQNVMPVGSQLFQFLNSDDRGALKLTINQFYRVNGDSTQNHGVRSDIVLPSILDNADLGESFLENSLEFDRVPAAPYDSLTMINDDMIAALKNENRRRVVANPEFNQLHKDIERYLTRKKRKTISLNEATLRKEREQEKQENKQESERKKKDEEVRRNGQGPIFPETFYNDEILRITLDYIAALNGATTAQKQ